MHVQPLRPDGQLLVFSDSGGSPLPHDTLIVVQPDELQGR
jgi:hypothetical protein